MGDVKRVLITGASGFIGRATVTAALEAGLEVVAVQRRTGPERVGLTYVSTDLTVRDAVPVLTRALAGCDAVIHLAAALSGDADAHKRLTIAGTERVIDAMRRAAVPHLTLVSSIAVFDTSQVPLGEDLTDDCPLENPAMSRDAYSGAKVRQENLARAARLASLSILRPGIVYDADHLWNAHLGIPAGPVLLGFGGRDPLPMCHVDRCAAALVQATLLRTDDTATILDATLPTRREVTAALQRTGWPRLVIPMPWQILWVMARILRPFSSNLPGLLREDVLRQRGLPMGNRLTAPAFADRLPSPAPDWSAAS